MFKVKRPAIIGLLLVLLVFTGYLNYQLTQQALRKSSKDYQNYELTEMANNSDEIGSDLTNNDTDMVIVDPILPIEDDVAAAVSTSNSDIEEAISKETSESNRNYFVEFRLSRDKLRANLVDRLEEIVNNSNTNDNVRTQAQEEIIKLGRHSEKELQIEGLIKSKGFEDALVFLTDTDIKAVISSNELTEQDMAKILDIIKSETDYDINNIKIMKKQ